jgi:glycosyltransferase involved in cell wall biosynthesis
MKLSVITINYNNCDGLRKTIESVVNQTCTDFEYIIIDGGSTDGSVDLIKEYAGRIDYWVSERDRGCYHAMNKGAKIAQGEYVIFMNSGDSFYTNDVIDAFVKENPTEDVLCGDMFLSLGCVNYVPTELTFRYFYEGNLPHQACFIKTSLQKKYPYNENLKIVSDYEFFLRILILENGTFRKINKIISYFDFNGISSENTGLHLREREAVQQAMFPSRILEDYRLNTTLDFRKLFYWIERTNFHKPIYIINVLLIKFVSFFTGAKWIKEFGVKEKLK